MKLKLLLLVALLSFAGSGYSQDKLFREIDSLQKVLPQAKADTLKLNLLIHLSELSAYAANTNAGVKYGNDAFKLSEQLKSDKGIIRSYQVLSLNYQFRTDFAKEREYLELGLKKAIAVKDDKRTAAIYQMLGINYSSTDYARAITSFNNSIKIYLKIKDYKGYCSTLLQLGGTYQLKGMTYQAADCFQKIIATAEKNKDEGSLTNGLVYLAGIYMEQGNYAKALPLYKKIQASIEKKNNVSGFTNMVLNNIGSIYVAQKNYNKGLEYYNKILLNAKKIGTNNNNAGIYLSISGTYLEMKNIAKATEYLDKAEAIVDEQPNIYGKMKLFEDLGYSAFNLKDYNRALQFHLKALQLGEGNKMIEETAISNGNVGATYLTLAKEPGNNKAALAQKGLSYLENAVATFKELKNIRKLETFSNYLSEAYELTGSTAKALSAYKDYITYRDTVYNEKKREEFIAKQSEYDYTKRETLLKAEQKTAMEHEKGMRNISYAGIGLLVIVASGAGYGYVNKRKANTIIAREKQRSEDLLLNILPAEVAEELKEKGEASAHYYEQVSILFTDFEGFTKHSEKMSPQELIGELNYCFKAFDHIITKYNIEKIKTIGDSYMAVSGMPGESPDHALNVVKAALEIRDFIVNYKEERKQQGKIYFEMRIGINSGEVVAGIVGIKKFAYDIWGDAVNIASRIETNGQVGKVNISESTYLLVKDNFDTEYRGEIEAKGKGAVKMYFVEPKQTV